MLWMGCAAVGELHNAALIHKYVVVLIS